jgi:hypothetical protein
MRPRTVAVDRLPGSTTPIETFESEFTTAGEVDRLRVVEPGGVLNLPRTDGDRS